MFSKRSCAFGLVLCLATGMVAAQQPPAATAADDEEQLDTALRKFGYVSGQAYQCHAKDQQAKVERTALDVATNVLRLFGSDRAFFYAAAFGAGASGDIDRQKCPATIKEASDMVAKLQVLSTR